MSVIKITKNNFESEVKEAKTTVILDFWAPWCGPCRMIAPTIDEIAEENTNIKVGKINVDEENELAQIFNVMSIPTIVVMKDGKIINRSIGVLPKDEILKLTEV